MVTDSFLELQLGYILEVLAVTFFVMIGDFFVAWIVLFSWHSFRLDRIENPGGANRELFNAL